MKRIGTVSYNIYCNFTNYGSALQSWALHQAIKKVAGNMIEPVLVDYCPEILADKDPLNPFANMWDKDEESRRMCELTMPAIRENYYKFDRFYHERFTRTSKKYTAQNFNEICKNEDISGFVCGSDTIFCLDEFGFDDGYYANYECMRNNSIAVAASFGDTKITEEQYILLDERIKNFKAIGLRETRMLDYVSSHTDCPVARIIDPTLLLPPNAYEEIMAERQLNEKYLLLYTRRYNSEMQQYAENLARKNGWKVVEISLRATNADKGHIMRYDAGVEEFLSLVNNAEYVVTNSFHGLMFSVQFKKQFVIFSRETGDSKIQEALDLFGLRENLLTDYTDTQLHINSYDVVHEKIGEAREKSLKFIEKALSLL